MAKLDYNAVGALTDVRRFEWDDTDELYNLIAQSQYQYNARNQITSIAHNNAAGNSIVSHGYLYNADGNITQYTNSIDGSVLYDYDFLGQLTGADYSNLSIHDESYQYDLNGNRELVTNANGDLVVYSTGTNNELTSDGAFTYAYDAEGNRISKTNAAGTERELYSWDYRNRLESVTKQEYNATTQEWQTVQIVEYAYDYNNVLIRKVLDANGDGISDSKTIFLPENYQTAIQLDDADLSDSTYETVSHRYLWTPGQQDKLLADVTPTETLWTLTDHLGTIRDIIQNTPSGLVVPAHIIYDAYGNVLSCKDANGMDIESPVLFGFTGKYFDADTQLQNNVNRWYDATTGRWLSTDPIGFYGNDTNLYCYVENEVILSFDSYGLEGYVIGTTDPNIIDDIGTTGTRGTTINDKRWYNVVRDAACATSKLYPDASKLLLHYLDNTGTPYTIDVIRLVKDDRLSQIQLYLELESAVNFANSKKIKNFSITSTQVPEVTPEDKNWYYSIGRYSMYGKGDVSYNEDCRIYTMNFTIFVKDRYNWDMGKSTKFLGFIEVHDSDLAELQKAKLAKEFDVRGSHSFTVKWHEDETAERVAQKALDKALFGLNRPDVF